MSEERKKLDIKDPVGWLEPAEPAAAEAPPQGASGTAEEPAKLDPALAEALAEKDLPRRLRPGRKPGGRYHGHNHRKPHRRSAGAPHAPPQGGAP